MRPPFFGFAPSSGPDKDSFQEGFIAALTFLTRLPLIPPPPRPGLNTLALAWYGVAGGIIGLCGGLAFAVARMLGLPEELAAAVALTGLVALTGGLHEDGLADTADGFGARGEPEDRLEVLRDSRIGTYGVLALVLVLLVRWQAMATLEGVWAVMAALITAGALSRAAMVLVAAAMHPARPDGLGAALGPVGPLAVVMAPVTAFVIALVFSGWKAGAAAMVVAVAVAALARLARKLLGGFTGDVLGASQQVGEVAALLALATLS